MAAEHVKQLDDRINQCSVQLSTVKQPATLVEDYDKLAMELEKLRAEVRTTRAEIDASRDAAKDIDANIRVFELAHEVLTLETDINESLSACQGRDPRELRVSVDNATRNVGELKEKMWECGS